MRSNLLARDGRGTVGQRAWHTWWINPGDDAFLKWKARSHVRLSSDLYMNKVYMHAFHVK